jgi:hypothetical protein
MAGTSPLSEHVLVSPRFTRSVALLRDFHSTEALDGYILTPTGRGVLHRLADALRGESSSRAWSLTGPYGSGKSAFALFVAQLLGGSDQTGKAARSFLQEQDPALWERFFGASSPLARRTRRLVPVLVSGSREPLEKALARGLARSLRRLSPRGRPPKLVEELEGVASQAGTDSSGSRLVALFEETLDFVARYGSEATGLLLIVDELGKFLEYGASNPDQGDVFVLQGLAEAAARAERPFLFLTILHQSLDRYTEHVSPTRRTEWAKVQGRFEDIAFEERTEQIVRLLGQAIHCKGPLPLRNALETQGRELATEARELGLKVGSLSEDELESSLAAAFPLHPLVSAVVGPLFRQLAQNERSLFAFLTAHEPFGFQEFLRQQSCGDVRPETYRLDRLYDYAVTAVGSALFAQQRGKHWAEVQSILERLQGGADLERRIAKVIGLLQALGAGAVPPACRQIIHFALREARVPEADIDAGLDALVRRSLVVFRRHTASYALWEGSDIDIEARAEQARRGIDPNRGLASFLAQQAPLRPLVARRHSYQTGTLRYFEAVRLGRRDEAAVSAEERQTGVRLRVWRARSPRWRCGYPTGGGCLPGRPDGGVHRGASGCEAVSHLPSDRLAVGSGWDPAKSGPNYLSRGVTNLPGRPHPLPAKAETKGGKRTGFAASAWGYAG